MTTKDGVSFNGSLQETNTNGNNILTISITTTGTKLQKANCTWKITGNTEFCIDLKDAHVAGPARVVLMN